MQERQEDMSKPLARRFDRKLLDITRLLPASRDIHLHGKVLTGLFQIV